MIQWLRTCLPVQGTRVQSLVWKDPTCCGATKLHTTATEPMTTASEPGTETASPALQADSFTTEPGGSAWGIQFQAPARAPQSLQRAAGQGSLPFTHLHTFLPSQPRHVHQESWLRHFSPRPVLFHSCPFSITSLPPPSPSPGPEAGFSDSFHPVPVLPITAWPWPGPLGGRRALRFPLRLLAAPSAWGKKPSLFLTGHLAVWWHKLSLNKQGERYGSGKINFPLDVFVSSDSQESCCVPLAHFEEEFICPDLAVYSQKNIHPESSWLRIHLCYTTGLHEPCVTRALSVHRILPGTQASLRAQSWLQKSPVAASGAAENPVRDFCYKKWELVKAKNGCTFPHHLF